MFVLKRMRNSVILFKKLISLSLTPLDLFHLYKIAAKIHKTYFSIRQRPINQLAGPRFIGFSDCRFCVQEFGVY